MSAAKQGKKRSSPGAEDEKNPLADVSLTDEAAVELRTIQRDIGRAELISEIFAQKALLPVYEKRREVLKTIPKFWLVALMNVPSIAVHAQHSHDQTALSFLEDVWVVRDTQESRVFTLEFHFKENPFFSDKVLKKEYKYMAPPAASTETPDADGITATMLDFSWERDVEPQAIKIDWKDDAHNLTKLYPAVKGEDDDDIAAESGSFFNFFEVAEDAFDLGVNIGTEVFPDAVDYFLGTAEGEYDSEEDEDSDEDEEEDEIDLETPRPKKQKKA